MQNHAECRKSEINVDIENEAYVCNLFKMLGEPSRLKIVCALMGTNLCVAHLAELVGMEQSAVSHQLRNLKQAGIVKCEKIGKQIYYHLDDMHVFNILQQAIEHVDHLKRN